MVPKGVKRLAISMGEADTFLTICLVVFAAGYLSFDLLLAIVALQKFTSKKIRDSILGSFNIFNIKVENT